jgi:N-acetylmuramic acid 6-phosphate etherase
VSRETDAASNATTEAANPRTADIDSLDTAEVVHSILVEDARVADAVAATAPELERACAMLVACLSSGGRWINLGAGTSGRLGVLDAAEIPPTFGLAPDRVQALIAGGVAALSGAVEGAEDDTEAARRDLTECGLGSDDVLVAISASGNTPYVVAAARYAREAGARSIGVTCNRDSQLARHVDLPLVVAVGPEVIAGSTRMKGGLAQKMILHTLSTAVMIRLGHVRGNRMTGLRAVNAKLRERALRILVDLTRCSEQAAAEALDASNGHVSEALARLSRQSD